MRTRGCLQICQQSWRRAFMPAQPGALLQGPVSTSARKSRAIVQCATQIALLDRSARATTGRKASSMCTGAGIKMASSKQPVGSAGSLRLRSDQMMGFLFHQKRQRGKIPWRRAWRQRRRPATPTHQLRALLRAFPRLPLLARGAGAPSKAAGPRAGGPLDGWCVVRWPTQGRQRRRILVCRTRLAAAPFWALQLAPLNVQASWTVGSTRNLRRMRWARPAAPGRGESAVTRGRPPKQGAPQRKCVRARRARSGTRGCCGRVRLFRIGDRLGKILTVNNAALRCVCEGESKSSN